MMRGFKVPSVLGALVVVFALACGRGGIKTIQKPDGQATTCSYGGKTYNPGDSFRQDCNTCSCGGNGQVGCTLMLCPTDAGRDLAPDAALPDAQADRTVPLDQAKDVKPTPDVLADLSPDLPPAADSAQDALLVTDTAKDSQLVVDARDVGGEASQFCIWERDMVLAIGQSIPMGDGCNTCTCYLTGMACTASICVPPPDAATLICSLWSSLTFGYDGGNALYQDSYFLEGAHMTIARTYTLRAGMDGPQVRSCSPTLPACGAPGVVSISTVVQDVNDPIVQIALGQAVPNLYGIDRRPVDGQVWSIARGSGGKILVGDPCPAPTAWCQPIVPGIQRLADDLKSLASAMVASPECAGL